MRHGVDRPEVHLDGLVDAEHARDDVALRVDLGLLRRDLALAHEVGHHAVVLRELRERAAPEEVAPTVAHVGDQEVLRQLRVVVDRLVGVGLLGHEGQGHHGGAHAAQVGVGIALVADAVVGDGDGLGERVGGRAPVGHLQRLHGQPGGHLTTLVAAHAVGHDEQVAVTEQHEAVLVDRAQPADVGGRPGPQYDPRHDPSSSTVLPICSLSPRCSCIGPVTLRRLR